MNLKMALIYFYDSSEIDKVQLSEALKETDHNWEFIDDKISIDNCNPATEVISVFVTSQVTREVINTLPNLKLIACRSTGFNNIDLQAANERDITVVSVPTYGENTVAEYAFSLLLALERKLSAVFNSESQKFSAKDLLGRDLQSKTIGVIGTGHIGQKVLKIANGFGMRSIAYDAFPKVELQEDLNFQYVDLDRLIEEADVISLHTPYLPSTHHIINQGRLNAMKTGAILINTARGELVDTNALIEVLDNGHLGGAALDVVEGEALLSYNEETALLRSHMLPENVLRHSVEISILKKMPNVIISPHNAYNTVEAIGRINQTTATNIIDFWYGNVPNKVKPPEKTLGKLIIVRHAESEWNAKGKWTGSRDAHLSENGFREAGLLGHELKKLNIDIDVAFCSEQVRTLETLESMLSAVNQLEVPVRRSSAINERDYGDYTGMNKYQVKDKIGEDAWNEVRRGWNVSIPNGESLKAVYDRALPYFISEIMPFIKAGKNVLLVAHGNSLRALIKYIEKISDEDISHTEMLFGDIVKYHLDDQGHLVSKEITHVDFEDQNKKYAQNALDLAQNIHSEK